MALQVSDAHRIQSKQLDPPVRLLLGPGPSNVHPRVLTALSTPAIGHLDPHFITLMNETQTLLRYAWQTDNAVTIPVSGTGSAAMECTLANTIEEGDVVLVAVNGYFGLRLADMAARYRGSFPFMSGVCWRWFLIGLSCRVYVCINCVLRRCANHPQDVG